jgi:hypothetical protein
MSDRTLCDSTRTSKRLARLSARAFGLFPYIFQETDDYGRFEADPEFIKINRFPFVRWVTPKIIEQCLIEYSENGQLFLWNFDQHRYGFFVGFEVRSGKYLSKRRKSLIPEPPAELLSKFLKDNNRFQTLPNTSIDCKTLPISQVKSSQFNLSQFKKEKKEDVSLIQSFYKEKINPNGLKTFSDTRWNMLRLRFEHFSFDDLKKVIENISQSTWHMDNKQNSFELLFRSDAQVEKYLNLR